MRTGRVKEKAALVTVPPTPRVPFNPPSAIEMMNVNGVWEMIR